MIINLIIITFSIVYIIDFSGFIFNISKTIWKILNKNKEYQYTLIKPFGCSLCMTFWVTLGYCYLIINLSLIYSIGIAVLCGGFLTVIIKKIINIFYNKINK